MDPSPGYDARLTRLERDLAAVMERLRALEGVSAPAPAAPPSAEVAPAEVPPQTAPVHDQPSHSGVMTSMASLLGRSFVVLGGAYLLRALTESGRLPDAAGILIGLGYAWFWLLATWRAAPFNRPSAQFHGVIALLIGFPLVWEATVRFQFLGAGMASLVIALLATSAFLAARRGRLHVVSGVAGFGTVAAAFATAWSTNQYAGPSLLLISLGTATYWLAEEPARGWLRWPTAIAAGLSALGVTIRATVVPPLEPAWLALLTLAVLLATMQGSLFVRVLMLDRNLRMFDMLQAASGLVIGIGGAALVARGSAAGLGLIGAVSGILALGAYLAAFFKLADRPHLARSYHTFATLGLVAAVAALTLLMSGGLLAIVALSFSIATVAWGARHLGGLAALHGAAYVTTALAASGALSLAARAWTQTMNPWPSVPGLVWLTLAVTAVCATLRPPRPGDLGDLLARSGRLVIAFSCVVVLGGAAIIVMGPLIAGVPADSGTLASLRTVLLSVLIVGLGAAARWPTLRVFSHLVYPMLALGGLHLLVDDFRHSRPSTLFLALACYGVAWAMGPRLAARDAAARN